MLRSDRVLEKETLDLLLAVFVHAARYGIRYSRKGDPRITVYNGYGIITSLPRDTVQLLKTSYITQLFFNCDINFG